MAEYTPNYNLYKPNRADSEFVDTTLSANFVTIDTEIKNRATDIAKLTTDLEVKTTGLQEQLDSEALSVQEQINTLVVNGDSSPAIAQALAGTPFTTLRDKLDYNDERLSDIAINIKSFGAVGDGVTDDTQAIIDAIAVAGNKAVFVPEGVFIYEGFNIDVRVKIIGEGTLKLKNGAINPSIVINASDVEIRGIRFDGNKAAQSVLHSLIASYSPNTKIFDIKVTNAYDKIILLEKNAEWSQVSHCIFENNGTVNNCNAVTVKASNVVVSNNLFKNHGNGHGVRTGYFNGESPYNVKYVIIQGNIFDTSQHNAITIEVGSSDISIIGNHIKNCPQAIKGEVGGTRVICIGNNMTDITLATAFNLLNINECIVIGNKLENTSGGYTVGENSIVENNQLINSSTGYNVRKNSRVSGNYAKNVRGTPYRLIGGSIEGNTAEGCENTENNYQFYVGEGTYPKGIVFKGNRVVNPVKGTKPLEAFTLQGTDWVATDNVLVEDTPVTDVGFRVSGLNSDRYILKNNLIKAVTSLITPDTTGKTVYISDNIK